LLLIEELVFIEFGEKQGAGQISQQSFSVGWRTSEDAAAFTMSHGKFLTKIVFPMQPLGRGFFIRSSLFDSSGLT
jgi:hypothetical protein